MVNNQMNRQESVTSNLHQLTSKPQQFLPTPDLQFQISWGDFITMSFILVMLIFTLQSFQLNQTLNLVHIQTLLQLNQLMMMKWNIYWNYSTLNMIMIFCMLNSICLRIDWWRPLLQKKLQFLLCCLIKMQENIFAVTEWMSQFSMFLPAKDVLFL